MRDLKEGSHLEGTQDATYRVSSDMLLVTDLWS